MLVARFVSYFPFFFFSVLLVFLLALMAANLAIAGDAYHWIDDQGLPHFGDRYTSGARVIELTPEKPNPQQLKQHQERQKTLRQTLKQQSAARHRETSALAAAAGKRAQEKAKSTALCGKWRTRLADLNAEWEIKRRRGYKAQDKRNYLEKRVFLRQQTAAHCK